MKSFYKILLPAAALIFTCASALFAPAEIKAADFDYNYEKAFRLFSEGYKQYTADDLRNASAVFLEALAYRKNYHLSQYFLAKTYIKNGDMDKAREILRSYISAGNGTPSLRRHIQGILAGGTGARDNVPSLSHNKSFKNYPNKKYLFSSPTAVAVSKDGFLYVLNSGTSNIVKIDTKGNKITNFGNLGITESRLNMPADIAVLSSGDIAVTDYGNDRVCIYDQSGTLKLTFGGSGIEKGKFLGPRGLFADGSDNLYVTDNANKRVQKFTKSGYFLMEFGRQVPGFPGLVSPEDVIFADNRILVSDSEAGCLFSFDLNGNFIEKLSSPYLSKPYRLCRSLSGAVYSTDLSGAIAVYSPPDGRWARLRGWAEGNFSSPAGLIASSENILYVADTAKNTVEVFTEKAEKMTALSIDIEKVVTTFYPLVACHVSIRGEGQDNILGLKEKNFRVYENSVKIFPISVSQTSADEKYGPLLAYALFAGGDELKEVSRDIETVLLTFIKKKGLTDRISAVSGDNMLSPTPIGFEVEKFLAGPVQPYLKGDKFYSSLYSVLLEANGMLNKKGIIIFAGPGIQENPDMLKKCTEMARYSSTPVFVVSVQKANQVLWLAGLAEKTGGKFYHIHTSERIQYVYEDMSATNQNRYVLFYTTPYMEDREGLWKDIRIEADYFGLKDYDESGYFMPFAEKK